MQEIVEFLKDPAKFSKLGGKIPKGVLLVGPPGTGQIIVNGAAAHLIGKGERIIIMSFAWDDKPITPRRIICNEVNEIIA